MAIVDCDSRSHRDAGKLNRAERACAVQLTAQGRAWIAQPCSFPLPGAPRLMKTYRPDFYLPDEQLLIEVIGCRGRRRECLRRAELFRRRYPEHALEVREIYDDRSMKRWTMRHRRTRKRAHGETSVGLHLRRPPTRPGEILLHEFLKPLHMTQSLAAKQLGMTAIRLNAVIRGRTGITADTALRFAKFTKTSPQFWMQLQNAVDLFRAQRDMAKAG
jgi:addiction module HigA family antidote